MAPVLSDEWRAPLEFPEFDSWNLLLTKNTRRYELHSSLNRPKWLFPPTVEIGLQMSTWTQSVDLCCFRPRDVTKMEYGLLANWARFVVDSAPSGSLLCGYLSNVVDTFDGS